MTDWHTPLLVLFTQAHGMSVLHETVFDHRLTYVNGLRDMGAEIEVFDQCLVGRSCCFHERDDPHSAVVRGTWTLEGADVEIPDVRAGFSYVIAWAEAKGRSTVRGLEHVERAYDRPSEKFSELGLRMTRPGRFRARNARYSVSRWIESVPGCRGTPAAARRE